MTRDQAGLFPPPDRLCRCFSAPSAGTVLRPRHYMVPAVNATPAALFRLVRPRQWVKNAFVAAPLFFTPSAWTKPQIAATVLAMIVFCLLSSAVYVINDYADRDADRLHPEKKT